MCNHITQTFWTPFGSNNLSCLKSYRLMESLSFSGNWYSHTSLSQRYLKSNMKKESWNQWVEWDPALKICFSHTEFRAEINSRWCWNFHTSRSLSSPNRREKSMSHENLARCANTIAEISLEYLFKQDFLCSSRPGCLFSFSSSDKFFACAMLAMIAK